MKRSGIPSLASITLLAGTCLGTLAADSKDTPPPVVTPAATFSHGAGAPADAVVLLMAKTFRPGSRRTVANPSGSWSRARCR